MVDEFDDPAYKKIIADAERVSQEAQDHIDKMAANKKEADRLEKEIEKMEKDLGEKMENRRQTGHAHIDLYKEVTAKIAKKVAEIKRLRSYSRGGRRKHLTKRTRRMTKRHRAK